MNINKLKAVILALTFALGMSACGNLSDSEAEVVFGHIWDRRQSGGDLSSADESSLTSETPADDVSSSEPEQTTSASSSVVTTAVPDTSVTTTPGASSTSGSRTTTRTTSKSASGSTAKKTTSASTGASSSAKPTQRTTSAATARPQTNTQAPQTSAAAAPKWYNASELLTVLNNAADSYSTEVALNGNTDQQALSSAYKQFCIDRLDVFWYSGVSLNTQNNQTKLKFLLKNGINLQTAKNMHTQLKSVINTVVNNAKSKSSSFDKIVYVHDYIVNASSFNFNRDDGSKGSYSYNCLVNGSSGSIGYSEAFTILMRRLGFECGMCYGILKADTGKAETFNYIKVNGNYYWIDCALDDTDSGSAEHDFCLVSESFLSNAVKIDRSSNSFVPSCNSMDDYYYTKKGQYFESFSFGKMNSLLSRIYKTGDSSVTIICPGQKKRDEFVNSYYNNLDKFEIASKGAFYSPSTVSDYKIVFKLNR